MLKWLFSLVSNFFVGNFAKMYCINEILIYLYIIYKYKLNMAKYQRRTKPLKELMDSLPDSIAKSYIPNGLKKVAAVIWDRYFFSDVVRRSGELWLTQDRIINMAQISKSSVKRYVIELSKYGLYYYKPGQPRTAGKSGVPSKFFIIEDNWYEKPRKRSEEELDKIAERFTNREEKETTNKIDTDMDKQEIVEVPSAPQEPSGETIEVTTNEIRVNMEQILEARRMRLGEQAASLKDSKDVKAFIEEQVSKMKNRIDKGTLKDGDVERFEVLLMNFNKQFWKKNVRDMSPEYIYIPNALKEVREYRK